jgi:hypothetical protein
MHMNPLTDHYKDAKILVVCSILYTFFGFASHTKENEKHTIHLTHLTELHCTVYRFYIDIFMSVQQDAASGNKEYKCHYIMTSNMTLTA